MLGAALVASCGAGPAPPAPAPPAGGGPPVAALWVGPSFAGLALTHAEPGLLVYGTCEPPDGEGGCAPPLQLRQGSVCQDHPLRLDVLPRRRWPVRGALAAAYGGEGGGEGDGHTEFWTGATAIRVHAGAGVDVHAVLAALRPVGRPAAAPGALAPPAFPAAVRAELRGVRRAHRRLGSVAAVRRALGISRSAVRDRLALARDLRALGAAGTTRC